MLPIQTILHPTDFSEQSGYALQLAGALARDYGARLVVLHVLAPPTIAYGHGVMPVDPQASFAEVKERLDALEIPGKVSAERRLKHGDAATEILGVARGIHADLIVMGTHGRTGLGRLLMGSVAEEVVRRASCPVLTIKTLLPEATPVPPGTTASPGTPVAQTNALAGGA